jgi:hypoxanthine phosphoribosyltransferase
VEHGTRDVLTWEAMDRLVVTLCERIQGEFDVLLTIARGGMVPASMVAYRLGFRNILVAAVAYYGEDGTPGEQPVFLQFPAGALLRGKRVLIVDEVWESGATIHAVLDRVRAAGGRPTTAVLHYKPARSRVPEVPDFVAAETDDWVVYPYKAGR